MISFCSKCWMPSTRPNLGFTQIIHKNAEGTTLKDVNICSACQWSDLKKRINWQGRQDYFAELCKKYGKAIVPYSGGKDSIYVAYKLREFGIDPLLVTVLPDLETEIGAWNRKNMCPDFKRVEITLSENKYRNYAIECFKDNGKIKHPWENAISAIVLQQAVKENIPFVVYGEEGGAEYGGYGGYSRALNRWKEPVDAQYLKEYYYLDKTLFTLPPNYDDLFFTQWSRFENWSPAKHREFAVGKGMRTVPTRSIGTFTCDSQISDILQDLHMYILFIKFGFGRTTADACIAIRDGWVNREEALEWIELYDGDFPNEHLEQYLTYLHMTYSEFCEVLEKHANREIMEQSPHPKARHIWSLKNWIGKKRREGTMVAYVSPLRWDSDHVRRW